MSRLLKELNKDQRQAVEHTEGPVLVLAGAGSGKTRTLTHRIAYLIAEEKTRPWNILAVTFTNKAAEEMQKRVKELLVNRVTHWPAMGTFHSICARLLRREIEILGFKKSYTIYNSQDSLNLIKKIIKELNLDPKKINAFAVQVHISNAKNELITTEQYAGKDFFTNQVEEIYKKYQEVLSRSDALDFDDLIMKTVELFQQHPKILEKYKKLWQHILVDEYQDTNQAQYILIKLLSGEDPNLCVVGDDYQAIYGFRGANYQNILNFEEDYPEAKVVLLEQNYRSTQNILNAAQEIISNNKFQKDKKLWTKNPKGDEIVVEEVADELGEGEFIIQEIFGLKPKIEEETEELTYESEDAEMSILDKIMKSKVFKKNKTANKMTGEMKKKLKKIDLSEYVVLYRTNAQSRALEEVFLKYGLPYKIIGGIRFYDRKEIKDLLAYLRTLVNPVDWISLERIIQAPPRGLGARTWQKIEQVCIQGKISFLDLKPEELPELMQKNKASFLEFQKLMQNLKKDIEEMQPTEIIDLILERTGFKKYIQDGTEEGERRWENLQELKTACLKFNRHKGSEGLGMFLEEVSLLSDQDQVDEKSKALQMMTVHAAKGLEFPNVFLVGMEEGLFPHSKCLFDPQDMEEERRLCYVALTRARKKAFMLYAAERTIYGARQVNAPSRFIDELPS